MRNYGQLIAKLWKQKGLTQEQLGKKLNVSYQTVSKWENNQSEPSLETIEKLADVFGITISQFFEMANMDEGEIVISNIDKTSVATISNNNDGSEAKDSVKLFGDDEAVSPKVSPKTDDDLSVSNSRIEVDEDDIPPFMRRKFR